MGAFINLDDSPMFQKQIQNLEQQTEELKNRCQRLFKDSKKFMGVLGEACVGDTFFADAVEAFGGGQDDPVSVSIGGPVMSKFIAAFRELATHKELLRSQVEHVLIDRLAHFLSVDLQDAKDSRRRFDKSMYAYDQAREKYASLKKSTRDDVIAESEEDLHNSKSAFERGRFNLVNSLVNIEAKKKYEFLESFSAIMDAHLRYFKQGYELLSQLEPFILQVLTYAQQSKELANNEQDNLVKRIQEFRTQTEVDQSQASGNLESSASSLIRNGIGMDSNKDVVAIMQASAKGVVQTIKQGYLLKRSSSLRSDWKRRFFVLDSHGTLYYYRNKGSKPVGHPSFSSFSVTENNNSVFGRFRQKHRRALSLGEDNMGCRTVDLYTSIIKIDAEDTDLRLCFRIVSPTKSYTLQAENEADRTDWMNKITGVIASLLHSHLQQVSSGRTGNEISSANSGASLDVQLQEHSKTSPYDVKEKETACVSEIVRDIPGNYFCAECGASEPDWASLNLGILMCIECSGVHRNLGVHISKVRSITLDVRVWEPTILDLFQSLGNTFCNSIWEELLPLQENSREELDGFKSVTKPGPKDSAHHKEKYIQAKYVEKCFVKKSEATSEAASIWEAVKTDNIQQVYRFIVTSSDENITNMANTTYDDVVESSPLYHHVHDVEDRFKYQKKKRHDPTACQNVTNSDDYCLQGCSLLHLATFSKSGKAIMLELLLQFGADINKTDYHGRTPLHHCIANNNYHLAKFLLKRGARPSIRDGGGFSVLERAMEMGAITDEELFVLLADCQ